MITNSNPKWPRHSKRYSKTIPAVRSVDLGSQGFLLLGKRLSKGPSKSFISNSPHNLQIYIPFNCITAIQWFSIHMRTIIHSTYLLSKVHCSKSVEKDRWELITWLGIMPFATLKARWRASLYQITMRENSSCKQKLLLILWFCECFLRASLSHKLRRKV